jgi:hypothetical protein
MIDHIALQHDDACFIEIFELVKPASDVNEIDAWCGVTMIKLRGCRGDLVVANIQAP